MLAEGLVLNGHEIRIHSLIGRKADVLKGRSSSTQRWEPGILEYVARPRFVWLLAMICYKLNTPPFWASWGQGKRKFKEDLNWSEFVIYDFPFAMPASKTTQKFTILNSHNVEHRLFYAGGLLNKIFSQWVLKREKRAATAAHFMAVSSEEERLFFSQITEPSKIILIPNCINEKRFAHLSPLRRQIRDQLGVRDQQKILFFAASSYGPNGEGLQFLLDFSEKNKNLLESLQLIFLVCGSVTKTILRTSTMITTGPVDLIEPYFAAADWAINPIFHGSGTSIKLAEMIAADLPVLTTKIGARGFDLEDQVDALFFQREDLMEILKNLPDHQKQQMIISAKAKNIRFLKPVKAVAPLADTIRRHLEPEHPQKLSS